MNPSLASLTAVPRQAVASALRLLNLRSDQADPEAIDAAIRAGARAGGTNAWVLVAAIVIASIGLNLNSTAVIIGAMLISPLMSPIIGIGYGLGVNDRDLIRRCAGVLALFTSISLVASTVYFLASPLKLAHSELLARTTPTIWDVLIAFFGGAAGMIGLTRKEKTTLIPGVAIATALMPPLCTAGYGLAHWRLDFLAGALYLFAINCVFIGLATLSVSRILRLPYRGQPEASARLRTRALVTVVALSVLVPSVALAYRLVQKEVFVTRAEAFLQDHLRNTSDVVMLRRDIDPSARTITVTLLGIGVTPALEQDLSARLKERMRDASFRIIRPRDAPPPKAVVLNSEGPPPSELTHAAVMAALENASRIAQLERDAAERRVRDADHERLREELLAQLPGARNVLVSWSASADRGDAEQIVTVVIDTPRRLPAAELARLKRWLAVRVQSNSIDLIVSQRRA